MATRQVAVSDAGGQVEFMPGDRMVKFHCAVTKVLSES